MAYYLGLTGGIASGKSTVAKWFKEKNVTVIDSDVITHELMQHGQPNWQAIVENFGEEYLTKEGEIDRQKLGTLVFSDASELAKLNRTTHPAIKQALEEQMAAHHSENLVVVDIPLLYEGHYEKKIDGVLVVYVDLKTQLARLMKRNNLTSLQAEKKITAQMSLEKKKQLSDFFIDNTGTIETTKEQFEEMYRAILSNKE